MAPKKPNPMEDPPTASSTEEEEGNEEGEEVDQDSSSEKSSSSDDEEEDEPLEPRKPSSAPSQRQQPPAKKPETLTTAITTPSAPQPQGSSGQSDDSSSGSSTDSSTDSDDEPKKTPVKPIATKPMKDKGTVVQPRSRLRPGAASSPSNAKKRANESNDIKVEQEDNNKVKKGGSDFEEEPKTEDTKKQLFQRLFSEDDEIALLKGLVDYSAKKGADPSSDVDGFFDFVKDSLQCEVTKAQLNDKIRRLKKKYMNNVSRGGKKGEEPSFSRPHDQKSYELSKKLWGAGGEGVMEASSAKKRKIQIQRPTPKANGKVVQKIELASSEGEKMEVDGNRVESQRVYDMFLMDKNVEDSIIKRGLELVDGRKRAELEERWRKLRIAQLELFVERTQLTLEQAKLVLEATKSSNH